MGITLAAPLFLFKQKVPSFQRKLESAKLSKNFAAKMAIASKEARETRYWIRLLSDSRIVNDYDFTELLTEIDEIVKILTKIVKTTQLEKNK